MRCALLSLVKIQIELVSGSHLWRVPKNKNNSLKPQQNGVQGCKATYQGKHCKRLSKTRVMWIEKSQELNYQRVGTGYSEISLYFITCGSHQQCDFRSAPHHTHLYDIYEFSVTAKGLISSEHYIKSVDNTQLKHTNEANPSHCIVIYSTDVLIRKH